ncbi:MAG: hypothetical protein IKR59_04800, partial [Lachnospiraceae bacterium]|nr:hypothetical protein [Lachnospiraceae bacterium]
LLAVCAALMGIIPNYSRVWDESYAIAERVYSIGITNTTDCAARVFFTLLVWFYLRGEKLTAAEYALTPVLGFIIYYFTGGRIDSGCVIIMTALFLGVNLAQRFPMQERHRARGKKALQRIALLSMPLLAALALYLVISYKPGNFRDLIDDWASHRFSIGHRIFNEYGVRLFGQPIQMYGNGRGGFNNAVDGIYYSFIDISYQSVLMLYGAVFFAVILVLYLYLTYRKREDRYLMLSVILIAFNCFFAHHLTEIAYIPFVLLTLEGTIKRMPNGFNNIRRKRFAPPDDNLMNGGFS